jgi:hypothetical protein
MQYQFYIDDYDGLLIRVDRDSGLSESMWRSGNWA